MGVEGEVVKRFSRMGNAKIYVYIKQNKTKNNKFSQLEKP